MLYQLPDLVSCKAFQTDCMLLMAAFGEVLNAPVSLRKFRSRMCCGQQWLMTARYVMSLLA